jgi:hypothetical protein
VLLGLLVEPSLAGAALGAATLGAFLVRTPLKLALVDRRRGRRLERTRMATRLATFELAVIALLGVFAVVAAEAPFWWPVLLAAPLIAAQLWFDVRSRSRRLLPELAGTVGVAASAPAIALAGGAASSVAAGLWVVAGARAGAAIPFVRLQLRRLKAQPHRTAMSDLAQVAAVVAAAVGVAFDVVPVAAAGSIVVLAALHAILARRPVPRAAIIGSQQVVLGLAVVLVTGLAVLAP